MTLATLTYTPGVLERRKFRRLLDKYECTVKESSGFFGKTFYVTAPVDEHVKLSKEFYNVR